MTDLSHSATASDRHDPGAWESPWQEYLSWNGSVAEALFPEVEQPTLVFLDIEGDALAAIAHARGIDVDEVVPRLLRVIRRVLDLRTLTSTFRRFGEETSEWLDTDRRDTPPAIALLAVFALAAERMERGEGVSSSNYYFQLTQLLDIEDRRVGAAYRAVADVLWDSLSSWLEYLGGRRGEPVTFSVGKNRYVGRAKAQALIRDVDRRRLQSFFQEYDLSAGSDIGSSQLEPLLHAWISESRIASAHLRSLWEQDEAREHVLAAVSSVLAGWNGHLTDRDELASNTSKVLVVVARRALTRGISISLALNVPKSDEVRTALLHVAYGCVELPLIERRTGAMISPELKQLLSPAEMLGGIITVSDPVAGTLKRLPRNVIVLRQDDLTSQWQEISQVQLGDRVMILARDDIDLTATLQEISGTDWSVQFSSDVRGLPSGWSLISGVTVVDRPSREVSPLDDLFALVPLTNVTFSLSGGLRLPRARRTYHCDAPPTVTVGMGGTPFHVSLFDLTDDDPHPVEAPWRSDDGATFSLDLSKLNLDPGVYGLSVAAEGTPRKELTLTLIRSGEVALEVDSTSVSHDARDPLFAVQRGAAFNDDGSLVWGVPDFEAAELAPESDDADIGDRLPESPWWRRERATSPSERLPIEMPGPESCLRTGAHVEHIETVMPDSNLHYRGTSRGVCRSCGRTRRYVNSYWKNRRRWERQQAMSAAVLEAPKQLGRERPLGTAADWDVALDAVTSLGGGGIALLRSLAQQIDPSARFFHEFVATLEEAGHVEIRRSIDTAEVTEWETAQTTIVDYGSHRQLIGHWESVEKRVLRRNGIHLMHEQQENAPSRLITSAAVVDIQRIVPDSFVSIQPGDTLAAALPSMSRLIEALPVRPIPDTLKLDRYEPGLDRWQRVPRVQEPGAFRTGGYSRTYFLVTGTDLTMGQARIVNVALAKHGSIVLECARPLVAYTRERELLVPLGAPLPGMYGRAAVLASGRAPARRDGVAGSFIAYKDVPQQLATRLILLLGS